MFGTEELGPFLATFALSMVKEFMNQPKEAGTDFSATGGNGTG
jgi:hypothetical protein